MLFAIAAFSHYLFCHLPPRMPLRRVTCHADILYIYYYDYHTPRDCHMRVRARVMLPLTAHFISYAMPATPQRFHARHDAMPFTPCHCAMFDARYAAH